MNRALRRQRTQSVIRARARLKPLEPPGKWAKRHPLDCGNTKCGICHAHKRYRGSKKFDRKADLLEALRRKEG